MASAIQTEKTVYVLGAGFSAPAGAPSQALLLQAIFSTEGNDAFVHARNVLRRFLEKDLGVTSEAIQHFALEDVFTPIDRCLADGLSLRGRGVRELQEIRERLEYLISVAIDERLRIAGHDAQAYVKDFATHLVATISRRAQLAAETQDASAAKAYDPVSVISLNWDMVLDRCIHDALSKHDGGKVGDYDAIGVVDYCCYISSLDDDDRRIRPGLWALGSRGYNVKLLKLHGSMNWLQCSNCQRLFVKFDEGKINILEDLATLTCRHCGRHGVKAGLKGSLVMPTFLKDLSNFQVKLIWQNAAVELLEARKIVFIGYSLPYADFEFRQLLSRMIHPKAQVEVILWREDNELQYKAECERYRQFFGGREIAFSPHGAKRFVDALSRRVETPGEFADSGADTAQAQTSTVSPTPLP